MPSDMDPLEFRLKNLKDERVRAVLTAAAQSSDGRKPGASLAAATAWPAAWRREASSPAARRFRSASDFFVKEIRVERVTEAFECGAIVNPEHLKNQVEGAIVMGIGGALFEAIDFSNGRILNPHLARSAFPVPRRTCC